MTERSGLSHPDHSKSPVEIFEATNAHGTTSKIASVRSDQFDAFMKEWIEKSGGKDRYDYGKDEWLNVDLQKILNKGGFDFWWSTILANKIINTYDPQTYNGNKAPLYLNDKGKNIGPHANISSENNPNVTKTPEVSAKCLIAHLTESHTGEAWTRALLQLGNVTRDITLPYDFGSDFAKFVRWHEVAHCMGANEQLADKIAAKLMLKDSSDIDKTLAFLELFKAIRIASVVFKKVHPMYYGSFLSVDDAIEEFKMRGAVPESREYIWSMALERNASHVIKVAVARGSVNYRMDLTTADDYVGMAKFVMEVRDKTSDDEQKKILLKMSKSFFLLGNYVEGPPRVLLQKSPSP